MIKRKFDLMKAHNVVMYLRMSSEKQNPRSPQQQADTIRATMRNMGYPWVITHTYADEAISGKKVRGRPGFSQMLKDIRNKSIHVDAILVDVFDRFGRSDQLMPIRTELEQEHGVLVLSAINNFTDPTTMAGRAMSAIEELQATGENEIKAHNVLRGKRDAVLQKKWPGGDPPFGFAIEAVFTQNDDRKVPLYSKLVPNPETAPIIRQIFELASKKNWGSSRIAKYLNCDPSIPSDHKPFLDQRVNMWLNKRIYCGDMVWGRHQTDLIKDRRVIEKNEESEIILVEKYCEPLISRETFEAVQKVRGPRSEAIRRAKLHKNKADGKLYKAVSSGLSVNYILSGLVICDHCGLTMVATSTPEYKTKSGEVRRYTSYACPGVSSGNCDNRTRIPEQWLREMVIKMLINKLS